MENGRVIESAAKKLDRFLRCHYNGKVHKIDRGLIKLMCRMDKKFGGNNTLQIISGYRSPEYNAILAKRSSGVASKSLHLKGMAVDFRIPGISMKELYRGVRAMKEGGAGIYSDFVHMDTGRVRFWGKTAMPPALPSPATRCHHSRINAEFVLIVLSHYKTSLNFPPNVVR